MSVRIKRYDSRKSRSLKYCSLTMVIDAIGACFIGSIARAPAGLRFGALAIVVIFASSAPAPAAEWPDRPVTLVVPFPAGGNTDTMARLLAQYLGQKFNQTFLVDNRGGASGAIATSAVARSAPDGYTLLFAAAQQISVIPYTEHVNYDPKRDLTPISIFGEGSFVLGINGSIPAQSASEFIDYVKKRPGELVYGSGGTGSLTHLSGALFMSKAGLSMIHVPYRGGGPAAADFIAGHVQAYFGNSSELVPFLGDERMRLIAVSTATRMPLLPNVPAVAELFPGFKMSSWNGLLGPARLPPEIIDRLAKATIEAAHDPGVVKILTNLGIAPIGDTPQEFARTIEDESALLGEAIKAAGLDSP